VKLIQCDLTRSPRASAKLGPVLNASSRNPAATWALGVPPMTSCRR
jgi:hypothetical protein